MTAPSEDVALRLRVRDPLPGVRLCVQRGRDALMAPSAQSVDAVVFDLRVRIETGRDGAPTLRGAEVQGPPAGRFVYVAVGRRAGQPDSPWTRRAKIPLAGLTPALLAAARTTPGAVLEAEIAGVGRDGGPACASVPLLGDGWRLVAPDA